jgi:S1-C subfamily serine protease
MSAEVWDAIVLIRSRDAERSRNFGTGFAIAKDGKFVYLLTCAHVIRDVGGREQVVANGIPATVVAVGDEVGFDLAVLQVEGLWDKPQLKLCASGKAEKPLIIAGFYQFDPKTPPALRTIRGSLGDQIQSSSKDSSDRANAWDLKIEGDYYLQPGYSGSPVIDKENDGVMGVVTHQIGKGEKGLAISIEALVKIWQEMPAGLITSFLPAKPIDSEIPVDLRKATLPEQPGNAAPVNINVSNSKVDNAVGAGTVIHNEASNFIRDLTVHLSEGNVVKPSPSTNLRRVQKLQESINEALELLEEYEQQERLSTDPKTRRSAQIEQERLRQQIERYKQEIKGLEC